MRACVRAWACACNPAGHLCAFPLCGVAGKAGAGTAARCLVGQDGRGGSRRARAHAALLSPTKKTHRQYSDRWPQRPFQGGQLKGGHVGVHPGLEVGVQGDGALAEGESGGKN